METQVDLQDRKLTIVGTAHVSEESKEEVRKKIESESPDRVFVELDENRYKSLSSDSGWKEMNLVAAIRQGQGFTLFLKLFLSIYQRRMGLEQGVEPGDELLEALKASEENGIEYSLVDRDINETFSMALE